MKKLYKLAKAFKKMWKFITEKPKERTGEEWEQYFAIAEVLRNYRKENERRNKKHRARSPYTSMSRKRVFSAKLPLDNKKRTNE